METENNQFDAPLIGQIMETCRSRKDMIKAQTKLTLQSKAILRRLCEGDKEKANKLYAEVVKNPENNLESYKVIYPLILATEPLTIQRKEYEKILPEYGKQLPIAYMADKIKGIKHMTLAVIVGELGDLSAYHKGISGIWKRAGLAVIDGERQRKCANADKAIKHGYSPERRAVFWNIGEALFKSQGKEESAGPYRKIYDTRKQYEIDRGLPNNKKGEPMLILAHKRAMRCMVKQLLKDLWKEWRAVSHAEKSVAA